MNIIIPIAIAVFVIIAVVLLVLPHEGTTTTTTNPTTASNSVTTIIPRSTLSSTTTIRGTNGTNCVSSNLTAPIYNGNFSTGTYAGWTPTGVGFGTMPANITYDDQYNEYYGQPWTGYNGTYFATSYSGGLEVAQGNLTSQPFVVTEPYLNFKVISPQDNQLYVEILKNGRPEITAHYNTFAVPLVNTTNSTNKFDSASNFFNASMIMVPLLCNTVQIKIVANLVGEQNNEFNYIAATGFYLSKSPVATPGIIVNQSFNFT